MVASPKYAKLATKTLNISNTKGVFMVAIVANKPTNNLENTANARNLIHGFKTGVTSCNLVLGEAVIDENSS